MKLFARILFPALLLATILTVLLEVEPFTGGHATLESLVFQVDWKPTTGGAARLYYDVGQGFTRARSLIANVAENTRQRSRFILPPGRLHGFRLELPNRNGRAEIFGVRITDLTENELFSFDPTEFWQDEDTDAVEVTDASVFIANGASLTLEAPLDVFASAPVDKREAVVYFVAAFLLCAFGLWKLDKSGGAWTSRLSAFSKNAVFKAQGRPILTLAAFSAAAVLICCHPVIFFGRSFVSPNNRAICLYDDFPTIPYSPRGPIEDPKASDIGAMLWSHLPYSIMEHQAIFHDGELPLWDHWNYCGVPLLGQGQTMIGDPLHWLPILANGAPWAWDVKFILARFVFCFGVGLLVMAAVDRLGIAALIAASSAFLGFFSYRFNHAAGFSLCYSSWILFAWLKASRSPNWRGAARWALLLIAANWVELNSGTAKESCILILGLNFSGLLVLLLAREPLQERLQKLAAAAGGLGIFLLISAPCWLIFLDALTHAFTNYDSPRAYQIQPSLIIGLFDDMFYRQTIRSEMHSNPAANFLVLLGVLWAAALCRQMASDRRFLAIAISALPPLAMAFGLVPPEWILRLPFFGNISHIDNTFSCVLIVLCFPIAAFGLRACRDRMASPEWRGDWVTTLLLCGALALAYFGFIQALNRSGIAWSPQETSMPKSPFFVGYSTALFLAIALLPLAARGLFLRGYAVYSCALICGLSLFAMHFRQCMYLDTKFDPYVMNPQARVDLTAPSSAVEYVKAHLPEPGRVMGFEGVLTTGFNPVIGLESPGGSDPLLNRYNRELDRALGIKLLWDWRLYVEKDSTALLLPFYDMLGIRYYLGSPANPVTRINGLRFVGTQDLDVYESPTAWPRAFFTDTVGVYQKLEEIPGIIWQGDKRPLALVQAGDGAGLPALPTNLPARRVVPAANYQITSNSIAFSVDAPAAGVAVVGEGFEAGNFRVTVNGKPASYFRVDHAFKGVSLPGAGHYLIRFAYWPRLLTPALCAAGLGIVLLAAAVALLFRGAPKMKELAAA